MWIYEIAIYVNRKPNSSRYHKTKIELNAKVDPK